MTTTSVTPARRPAGPATGGRAGFANLMRAEWTKIRSVRSTVWTLLIFIVVCVGLTALIAWLTESHWYGPQAAPRDARAIADPVGAAAAKDDQRHGIGGEEGVPGDQAPMIEREPVLWASGSPPRAGQLQHLGRRREKARATGWPGVRIGRGRDV